MPHAGPGESGHSHWSPVHPLPNPVRVGGTVDAADSARRSRRRGPGPVPGGTIERTDDQRDAHGSTDLLTSGVGEITSGDESPPNRDTVPYRVDVVTQEVPHDGRCNVAFDLEVGRQVVHDLGSWTEAWFRQELLLCGKVVVSDPVPLVFGSLDSLVGVVHRSVYTLVIRTPPCRFEIHYRWPTRNRTVVGYPTPRQ